MAIAGCNGHNVNYKPALLVGAALLQSGCATNSSGSANPRDHFERFNRAMYKADVVIDKAVLAPVARSYVRAVPLPASSGISHFLANLNYSHTVINEVLQGKLTDSGRDVLRLFINTIVGVGFFDPAANLGLAAHLEDFGQTLDKWGVPSDPYLVLPVLGPSTVRDTVARVPDEYTSVRHYMARPWQRWSSTALGAVDTCASLIAIDGVLATAFDPYAFVRNAWLQRREYQVRDGNVPAAEPAAE
jgi:phospholipid-binding lipoprotein MlaA